MVLTSGVVAVVRSEVHVVLDTVAYYAMNDGVASVYPALQAFIEFDAGRTVSWVRTI